MSNFNGDLLDDGLQSLMGKDRCKNVYDEETRVVHMKKERREKDTPDASWVPVAEPGFMEKLKKSAKSSLLFGGLSLMFFYFQQSGQMLPSAAMPCICACCILLGLGVGKNAR